MFIAGFGFPEFKADLFIFLKLNNFVYECFLIVNKNAASSFCSVVD